MQRVSLDLAGTAVKEFVQSLPVHPEGVELELSGQVICKVIPANSLSDVDKAVLIERGRQLVRRARQRNNGVPASVIEREVQDAVDEVRRRKNR